MKNLVYIENGYAHVAIVHEGGIIQEYETSSLSEGRYVRKDDGNRYPQICYGGGHRGNTIEYQSDGQLAKALRAKLYKTRNGYERAKARLNAS